MYLKHLELEQFRCYQRLALDLGPGIHILVGENASGKTTLLEAIHLLAVTKSHRTAIDRELIKWGEQWARASGSFCTARDPDLQLRVTLRQRDEGGEGRYHSVPKIVEVNSVPRRRLGDLVGQIAVVLFGPDDLELVKGSPEVRRRFLNGAIAQVRPPYLADLVRYRRALAHRNECLKALRQGMGDRAVLSAWDPQLVETGARLAAARSEFVRALAPHARRIHHDLSGGTEVFDIAYVGDLAESADLESRRLAMRELMSREAERDIAQGRTVHGPHRDELALMVNGKSVRNFGSQGQQRTAALSLILAEAAVMEDWRGEPPILLLDDCLSELDEQRAARVLALTQSVEQMVVTTATWQPILASHAPDARRLNLTKGTVREA